MRPIKRCKHRGNNQHTGRRGHKDASKSLADTVVKVETSKVGDALVQLQAQALIDTPGGALT